MKMIKNILFVVLFGLPMSLFAQLDCSDFFKYRTPETPFRYNEMSKSAVCVTGNKYEFVVPLQAGADYRLSFYASPVFNNAIEFKVIDQSSGEVVMSLPGDSPDGAKGSCVLKSYFDEKRNKSVHPYFDFFPAASTTLKIIIDVKPLPEDPNAVASGGYKVPTPRERGCITVLLLDKKADNSGFSSK